MGRPGEWRAKGFDAWQDPEGLGWWYSKRAVWTWKKDRKGAERRYWRNIHLWRAVAVSNPHYICKNNRSKFKNCRLGCSVSVFKRNTPKRSFPFFREQQWTLQKKDKHNIRSALHGQIWGIHYVVAETAKHKWAALEPKKKTHTPP